MQRSCIMEESVNHESINQCKSETTSTNLAIIFSRTQLGMSAISVNVEVHLSNGLPAFNVVGMPETAVKESKDRVRSAITSSKFEFPARRITVNLAPADVPKVGGRFDLPIALGILVASGQIKANSLSEYEIIGELGLTGQVKKVAGCLPSAIACKDSNRKMLLPQLSAKEASFVEDLELFPVNSLSDAAGHFTNMSPVVFQPKGYLEFVSGETHQKMCFSEIKGQSQAKNALEIAASGGHHLLMSGPPGCGKTMLATRFRSILPELSTKEALETASIYSVSEMGFDISSWKQRPFRAPHHSASAVALIGGGGRPKPGEISMAHNGVLFLDELPEFSRQVLDQLREPIEAGYINIVRANARVTYLSQFQLIAAMNVCRCGYFGDQSQPNRCQCSQASIENYRNKVSGPLMDRIDMHIHLARIPISELQSLPKGETSDLISGRVKRAQMKQYDRQGCLNAKLRGELLDRVCELDQTTKSLLIKAESQFNLSARGYIRVLKISRTIADMFSEDRIQHSHVMQALNFRQVN